jgi:hypothetical protein
LLKFWFIFAVTVFVGSGYPLNISGSSHVIGSEDGTLVDSFSLRGSIDSFNSSDGNSCGDFGKPVERGGLILPTDPERVPWKLSGNWIMDVDDAKVVNFSANFSMVGKGSTHSHTIYDLIVHNNKFAGESNLTVSPNGITIIKGTVDLKQTCAPKTTNLPNLPVTIELTLGDKYQYSNGILIALDPNLVGKHFGRDGGFADGVISGNLEYFAIKPK